VMDRPTSEAIRFNIGSMARVKRRMRRSRPTITRGMLMLSRRLARSRFTLLYSTLLIFSSSFSVLVLRLADSSSSCAGFQLPRCRLRLFVGGPSSSRVVALSSDDGLQVFLGCLPGSRRSRTLPPVVLRGGRSPSPRGLRWARLSSNRTRK